MKRFLAFVGKTKYKHNHQIVLLGKGNLKEMSLVH